MSRYSLRAIATKTPAELALLVRVLLAMAGAYGLNLSGEQIAMTVVAVEVVMLSFAKGQKVASKRRVEAAVAEVGGSGELVKVGTVASDETGSYLTNGVDVTPLEIAPTEG